MTETFDLHTRLSEALASRAEAWRFVADFAAHWQQPLQPGDGWSEAEVEAAERRLGLVLPAALREAYLLLGRRTDLTSNHDTLLKPDELDVLDGALVYRVENQGAASWGVLLADLDKEDPGTVIRPDLADKSRERWEAWESGLIVACVEMVMAEVVLFPGGFTDFLELDAEEAGVVGQFRELPSAGRDVRWFADADVLIREVDGFCLDVRARTEEALDRLRESVPGNWLEG
ncbi:SMI1/KNR4 family protein [Streptomyces liangshanensis]|uniref:SMI1/KNR4 family protein n=1 Tax=Streptomyces liangshanensis TaxID=2717324 RepID=A0A6G9H126_9ACTN|nr:SMI1/KNR4 family protein [Streptomyces liangshanensis]QIQ04233.1 SMI1/KNR4 family protein [Streptomyces liangshanensis]